MKGTKIKRRKLIALLTGALLLFTVFGVYAAERIIVPDMTFGGETVNLSLDDAIRTMKTEGSRADAAAVNKKSDEAVAKGYAEGAESILDLLSKMKAMEKLGMSSIEASSYAEQSGATELNEKIMKLRRDFARSMIDANYEAEMNQIEADTISIYYGVLQADENLRIAKENLVNQQRVLDNTKKKYKQGVVARIDVLTSETSVLTAQNEVSKAKTLVDTARMNFNMLLGYDLMQKVVLTDTLKMVEEPKGNLTEWIKSAVSNRNEIKGSGFAAEIQKILLDNLKYRYPENSATYLSQQAAWLSSAKAKEDAPVQIEMDIRIKYMDMADKLEEAKAAEAVYANAKEGARLASITFDVGMNTVSDVHEAEIRLFRAGQGLAKAISDYDIAVYSLRHSTGVGTMRMPL
jgi:hypothetical protein